MWVSVPAHGDRRFQLQLPVSGAVSSEAVRQLCFLANDNEFGILAEVGLPSLSHDRVRDVWSGFVSEGSYVVFGSPEGPATAPPFAASPGYKAVPEDCCAAQYLNSRCGDEWSQARQNIERYCKFLRVCDTSNSIMGRLSAFVILVSSTGPLSALVILVSSLLSLGSLPSLTWVL